MADPIPTDPELLRVIEFPKPAVTEDPLKIGALDRQADALGRQAAAAEKLSATLEAGDTKPVSAWDDGAIWWGIACVRAGTSDSPAEAGSYCDAMLAQVRMRFPKA